MASPKATDRQATARPARSAVDEASQQQPMDGPPYLGPGELRAQSDSIANTLVVATKSVEVERLVRETVHRATHLGSQDLETILQRVAHPGHVLMAVVGSFSRWEQAQLAAAAKGLLPTLKQLVDRAQEQISNRLHYQQMDQTLTPEGKAELNLDYQVWRALRSLRTLLEEMSSPAVAHRTGANGESADAMAMYLPTDPRSTVGGELRQTS